MNRSDVTDYTLKDRSHWLCWLLRKRRLAERWGCPELIKPGAAEAEATRVLQDLGFFPPGEIEACEDAHELLLHLEDDGAYPLRWWADPQDAPPSPLVGDYVDKCLGGIVPVDALASRWDCAILVTDEQYDRRKAERGRRDMDDLAADWLSDNQPPECGYEPELNEDDMLDEAVHLRQIEDAEDDPGDREEAMREYGHWKGEGGENEDDYGPLEDEDAPGSWEESVVPAVQFPAWIHEQMEQEVCTMLDCMSIQERLGKRSKADLQEGLSAALTTEWLLLLAEHRGDWSASALGYFKCLERVLVASLCSACGGDQMKALENKGMGACVAVLFEGASDVLGTSVTDLVQQVVIELRKSGDPTYESLAWDLEKDGARYQSRHSDGLGRKAARLWWEGVLGCAIGLVSRSGVTNILKQLSVARLLRNKVAHVTPVGSEVVRFVRGLLIGPFVPCVNAERPIFSVSSGLLAVVSGAGVDSMIQRISIVHRGIRPSEVWKAWSNCYMAFLSKGGWSCAACRSTVWLLVQECDVVGTDNIEGFRRFAANRVAILLKESGSSMGLGAIPDSGEWDQPEHGLGEIEF